jgi:hypothetical protein
VYIPTCNCLHQLLPFGKMDHLTNCLQNYPVLETLCNHVSVEDLNNLASLNSAAHGAIKGTPAPAPSIPATTFKDDVLVCLRCTCRQNGLAPCPLHGSRTWRNLIKKLRHTCMDLVHTRSHDDDETSELWTKTLLNALDGVLRIDSCCRCDQPVCFPCWWSQAVSKSINMRGNRRAKQVCHFCWAAPRKDATTGEQIPSLKTSYENNEFCACGPTPLCSTCTDDLHACYQNQSDMPLGANHGQGINEPNKHPWQLKCSTCPVFLNDTDHDIYLARYICLFCALPMRMRPNDHSLQKDRLSTPDPHRTFAYAKVRGYQFVKGRNFPPLYIEAPPPSTAHYEDHEEYWKVASREWVWVYILNDPKTLLSETTRVLHPPKPPPNPQLLVSETDRNLYWSKYKMLYRGRNARSESEWQSMYRTRDWLNYDSTVRSVEGWAERHLRWGSIWQGYDPHVRKGPPRLGYFSGLRWPVWEFEKGLFGLGDRG